MKNKAALYRLFLSVVCMGLFFLSGCASSQGPTLTETSNGKQISLKVGRPLLVRLESNPPTGYTWAVAGGDGTVLKQQGDPTYEQANTSQQVVGGGGWQTFRFTSQKAGATILKLVYRRSWEKGVAPVKAFTVQVTVQ